MQEERGVKRVKGESVRKDEYRVQGKRGLERVQGRRGGEGRVQLRRTGFKVVESGGGRRD